MHKSRLDCGQQSSSAFRFADESSVKNVYDPISRSRPKNTCSERIVFKIFIAFSIVISSSSDVTNKPNGNAHAIQLVYKSVIDVFSGSNDADASR